MVPRLGISVSYVISEHRKTSCRAKCLSMGSTRSQDILTEVFQDLTVFITTSASCLGKGSSCGLCTFVDMGYGYQNFPFPIACTALRHCPWALLVLAPSLWLHQQLTLWSFAGDLSSFHLGKWFGLFQV